MPTSSGWKQSGDYFDFNGHRIFFKHSATSSDMLLCIHGFPTSSFDYRKIWEPLSKRFSLLTFDLIGYGFSDKPPDFSYTTFDQADVLEAFVRHTGIRSFHVLAHDYGNTITLETLARIKERDVGFEIESICFLNGALFPETHRPIFAQKLLAGPLGAVFGKMIPNRAFKRSLASVFGPETQPTDDELEMFLTHFNGNGGRNISHKLIRYMSERQTYRERWFSALASIKQPFRLINGLADPVSGRHLVKRFREIVPGQKDIIELEGVGHFPHVEKPGLVLRHLFEFHGIPTNSI